MLQGLIKFGVTVLAATMLQPASADHSAQASEISPHRKACPAKLNEIATCYAGRDVNGAWYLIAIPQKWNQILVVHAHGGPRLSEPKVEDADEDLERFAIMIREGYAWIGSTYRRGGYGVRLAADDVDNSRVLFWEKFGKPKLTILHGQSYGGNVAAKLAELRSIDANGEPFYNGVLLTNAVLRGGTRAYQFRADLRAVYQYFCRNHPNAEDVQYPVWQGLPNGATMKRSELEARVDACLGLNLPSSERTTDQRERLASITGVTGISEKELLRHIEWATFTFQDLVHSRIGGKSPFDNSKTIYRGSSDDENLNRGIERFSADEEAVSKLAYDADLTGLIVLPTIAVHWADDPVVAASSDREYQAKIASQGNGSFFQSIWTTEGTHSRLRNPDLLSALKAAAISAEQGKAINTETIVELCRSIAIRMNERCTMLP